MSDVPTLIRQRDNAISDLQQIGLSPSHYPTLESCVIGAREIVTALRRDLSDPPPDVQEAVLTKLDLWHVSQNLMDAKALAKDAVELLKLAEKGELFEPDPLKRLQDVYDRLMAME